MRDPYSGQLMSIPDVVLDIAREHCDHMDDPEDEDEDPCWACIIETLDEEEGER